MLNTDGNSLPGESRGGLFGLGQPNEAFAQYFVGRSYLKMLTTTGVPIANVTFEPGCRNNWHVHQAGRNGGQILLCTEGRGWYQEWDREAQELASRRYRGDSRRRQALARRGKGQLVYPSGNRSSRRKDLQ